VEFRGGTTFRLSTVARVSRKMIVVHRPPDDEGFYGAAGWMSIAAAVAEYRCFRSFAVSRRRPASASHFRGRITSDALTDIRPNRESFHASAPAKPRGGPSDTIQYGGTGFFDDGGQVKAPIRKGERQPSPIWH